MQRIGHCSRCRNFSEEPVCSICASSSRDRQLLCVVESPSDLAAIEQATGYRGRYFVLMGRLSPLDGLGPEELGLAQLAERLGEGEIEELVIATNPTVEGEATSHYLAHWHVLPACDRRGWPTACRWVASWNTSIAARWRTRSAAASRLIEAEAASAAMARSAPHYAVFPTEVAHE